MKKYLFFMVLNLGAGSLFAAAPPSGLMEAQQVARDFKQKTGLTFSLVKTITPGTKWFGTLEAGPALADELWVILEKQRGERYIYGIKYTDENQKPLPKGRFRSIHGPFFNKTTYHPSHQIKQGFDRDANKR